MKTSTNGGGRTSGRGRLLVQAGVVLMAGSLSLAACAQDDDADTAGTDGEAEPAGDAAADLSGETVNIVAPYAPGGSYDRLARAVEPGFEEASGSTVVVQNEPGAGSLLATNRTFAASPDEWRMQLLNTVGVVAAQVAQEVAEGVNYDLSEFEWVGSFSNEPEVLVVAADSPLAEPGALLEAVESQEVVRYGATGPGDNTWIDAFLLRDVIGLNIEIVSGFDGAPDIYSGVLRGDVDVTMTSLASALTPITAGDGVPALYIGHDMAEFPEANEFLQDVPELREFAADAGVSTEDLETFVEPYSALLQINRTLVAPPGTDEARLAAYREAFDAAVSDEDLVADHAEERLYILPTSAQETEQIVLDALDAHPEFVALLEESFATN